MNAIVVRAGVRSDLDQLARIWFAAWHESHAHLVPPELTALRTEASFRERLAAALPSVCVAGPAGAPAGFCIVKGDELYQLFVAAAARGSASPRDSTRNAAGVASGR